MASIQHNRLPGIVTDGVPGPSHERKAATLNRRRLQVSLDQLLRHTAAYLVERDFCCHMREHFGPAFLRGQEKSRLDGLLLLPDSKIVGLEVKSLVQMVRDGDAEGKSGPFWYSKIHVEEGQKQSDVFCVGFPLLRGGPYWALDANLAKEMTALHTTFYQFSETGHRIDNVVPPRFWPMMRSLGDAVRDLKQVHAESSTQDTPQVKSGNAPYGLKKYGPISSTKELLTNNDDQISTEFLECIRAGFNENPSLGYVIEDTKYAPLTSDFVIAHTSGRRVFVEMKHSKCDLAPCTTVESESTISISHAAAHNPWSAPIFTFTGSRWTYELSELSGHGDQKDRLNFGGRQIPKYMLLMHRERDIPKNLWYQTPDQKHQVTGDVPRQCVIDFSKDFATQMACILDDAETRPFALPKLEDVFQLTTDELHFGVKGLRDDLVNDHNVSETGIWDAFAVQEMTRRHPHYVFQADASLEWLRRCRIARQGLVFDFEASERSLRAYAFTAYDWNTADVAYTSVRPRRPPKQLFQDLPHNDFVLLSFGIVRFGAGNLRAYVPPFVMTRLQLEFQQQDSWHDHRLLILTANPSSAASVDSGSWDLPVFAVPARAIKCDAAKNQNLHDACQKEGIQRQNHTRWQTLALRQGATLSNYRHDDWRAVLQIISKACRAQSSQETPVQIGGHELRTLSRQALLQGIGSAKHMVDTD